MLIAACSLSLCLLVVFVFFMDRVIDIGFTWAHHLQRWFRPSASTRRRLHSTEPPRYLGSLESSSSSRVRSTESTS